MIKKLKETSYINIDWDTIFIKNLKQKKKVKQKIECPKCFNVDKKSMKKSKLSNFTCLRCWYRF